MKKNLQQLKTVWVCRSDVSTHDLRRNSDQYTLTSEQLDFLNPDNIVEFPVESLSPRGTHVVIRTVDGFGPEHTVKLRMGDPVERLSGCAFANYMDALQHMLIRAIDACDNYSLLSAAGMRKTLSNGYVLDGGHAPDVERLHTEMMHMRLFQKHVDTIINYIGREQARLEGRQHEKR